MADAVRASSPVRPGPALLAWVAGLLLLVAPVEVRAQDATAQPGPGPALTALSWEPNPNPRVPLVLLVRLTTDRPTRALVALDDGERPFTVEPAPGLRQEHDLVVLGARADSAYRVQVIVEDEQGRRSASEPWDWRTPPLPEHFPPLQVTVARPGLMEPGVTLIPAVRWDAQGPPHQDLGAVVALDARGDVVWFFDAPWPLSEIKRRRNGNLLGYHGTRGHIIEFDLLGNVVREWFGTRLPGAEVPEGGLPVDAGTIHHEVIELPNGHLVALSTELWLLPDYPSSESDPDAPPRDSWVVGDVILEIAPDGTVLDRIALMDLLDPYRIGYESLDAGFWSGVYDTPPDQPLCDWSHANSIHHDEQENALIVSCYHLDTVFAFDLDDRELTWMVSFPEGWGPEWQPYLLSPVGDGLYPFHQHAARLTPQRTLLMFDNGKYRARPFTPGMPPEQSFSRAVEFALDPQAMTFEQVWSYGGRPGERFFTAFLGETDWLPRTENVLITDGGRIRTAAGTAGIHPNQGQKWARVLEVTHETPARVVFEVLLDDPAWGWTVYRSERLPDLYPVGEAD